MFIWGFTPLEFVVNFILYYAFFLFADQVMTCRIRSVWRFAVYGAATVFILFFSSLVEKMSALCVFALPVELMLFNLLLFRDKPLRAIFSAWCCFLILLISEFLVIGLFFPQEVVELRFEEMPILDQVMIWSVDAVSLMLLLWLVSLGMNRVRNKFSLREMLMYAFFPVSQCFMLYGWMMSILENAGDDGQQVLALVVMVICLAADVGLFTSMFRVSRQIELEAENRLLAAQIERQRAHYEELTAQYESIRRMRHDIAKHIDAMDALLATGRGEDAAAYVSELAQVYDRNDPGAGDRFRRNTDRMDV